MPKVAYLDFNKWIDIAKCANGVVVDPQLAGAISALARHVEQGRLRLPISAAHIFESAKIANDGRRARIAETLWQYSGGASIAPLRLLARREMACAVMRLFGVDPSGGSMEVFGRGISFACGVHPLHFAAGASVPEQNSFDETREMFLDAIVGSGQNDGNLRVKQIRAEWIAARDHQTQATRGMALRDRIRLHAAQAMTWLQDDVEAAANRCGRKSEDVFAIGAEKLLALITDTPTVHVLVQLGARLEQETHRRLQENDLTDMSFLCPAIAHCDVVVTEKLWADLAKRARFNERFRVCVVSSLVDLAEIMERPDVSPREECSR